MALIFITTILSLIVAVRMECPPYWTPHGDSCYVIPQIAQSWTSAMGLCIAHGGYLAEITTKEESNFVNELIREKHLSDYGVWLGASDSLSEGNWIWSYSGHIMQYENWDVDEPDGLNGQHCLVIIHSGKWDDYTCTNSLRGICERRRFTEPAVGK